MKSRRKKVDKGKKTKYRSVKLYKPTLSPIEEEYIDPYKFLPNLLLENSMLSRKSSINNDIDIIIDNINDDIYIYVIQQIMENYDSDCGIYEENKKIINSFKYLIKLNDFFKKSFKKRDAKNVIKTIKKGLKKIEILKNECFVTANTLINLSFIQTFFEDIITNILSNIPDEMEKISNDGKRKSKKRKIFINKII
jgi:hypothetical protein